MEISPNRIENWQLLRLKRESNPLLENFIFEKSQRNSVKIGKYENIAFTFNKLMSFNWNNKQLIKAKIDLSKYFIMIGNYLNPQSFWFNICSQYFPLNSNKLIDNIESLEKTINLLIEKFSKTKHPNPNTLFKDLDIIFSQKDIRFTKIDNFINKADSLLNELKKSNSKTIYSIIDKIRKDKGYILTHKYQGLFNNDNNDILRDLIFYSKYQDDYIDYIKKQNMLKTSKLNNIDNFCFSFEDEIMKISPDDIVCFICSRDEYEQHNLIVFCSSCNIAVHQFCYGILIIPQGDWICDVCYAFNGEYKNIECLLCPVKGGALKKTNIKKNSPTGMLYLSFRNTLLSGEANKNRKETFFKSKKKPVFANNSINKENLVSTNYDEELISNEFIWVHLTCAYSNQNLKIKNLETKLSIIIEKLEKTSFLDTCSLCKKIIGTTAKCNEIGCNVKFHAECGRMNKIDFEASIQKTGEVKYMFYCFDHSPIQLLRQIEIRKQTQTQDIIFFAKSIEKCLKIINSHKKKKIKKRNPCHFKIIKKLNNDEIIKDILSQGSELDIDKLFYLLSDEITVDYKLSLDQNKFPWNLVQIKNLSQSDVYKIYKSIITCERDFNNKILKKSEKKIKIKYRIGLKESIVGSLEKQEKLYCYCRRKECFGVELIACENEGNNCIYNGWFHKECDDELKAKSNDEIRSLNFTFYCKSCKEKKTQSLENYFHKVPKGIIEYSSCSSTISNLSVNVDKSIEIEKKTDKSLNIEISEGSQDSEVFQLIL